MAESLQDQLVKAGLADEKRARETRKEKSGKRNKQPKRARGQADQQAAERNRQAQAQKAKRDRQLEEQRQAKRHARETADRIRQIVASHRLDRAGGEAVYRFTQGRRIKEVQVTERQRQQLARGDLAIIAVAGGYEAVPAAVAERVRALDASAVRVANALEDARPADAFESDDPYAAFPVPDDLVW